MNYRKKLIEVSLPLEAINKESAREKSIRHGHPSTLHLWWARRPLAACRAVLFTSLVDDPSAWPELFSTEEDQEAERQRLFRIIEELVKWESTTDEKVILTAQTEIARSIARNLGEEMPAGADAISKYIEEKAPPVFDPFCGGGSIPLEAQRLGLRAFASDLNPVAVLITKALIEIPPRFAGKPPVNPEARKENSLLEKEWKGAEGLAEDIRFYGKWMRDEAEKRIGHLYPKIKVTEEMAKDRPDLRQYVDEELTVIAWLWARTVKCPNPACGATMPLVSSFVLSSKKHKGAWVEPVINEENNRVDFMVQTGEGTPPDTPKIGRGAKFKCLVCGEISESQYVKDEGMAGRMKEQLMAIAVEGNKGRVYLAPDNEHSLIALSVEPTWKPEEPLANDKRAIWCPLYGLDTFDTLSTNRQLAALTTFSDLVMEARKKALEDSKSASTLPGDERPFDSGGNGPTAYADAIATYLAFVVDRVLDRSSTICTWDSSKKMEALRNTFARQALPMTWDFAEGNPFSGSSGNWNKNLSWITKVVESIVSYVGGVVLQRDATVSIDIDINNEAMISSDPPYYDNIGYADLSDFFYVWLRRSLGSIYPNLFATLLTPKKQELIASPYRHEGSKGRAQTFFEEGLGNAFAKMRELEIPDFPMTIYYAFKQAESETNIYSNSKASARDLVIASTGWETMLIGLIRVGFLIHGTWPIRTELSNRQLGQGANALASSIVLVCRPRPEDAPMTTRRDFIAALKNELPKALINLQHGNIAPVDLAQASIGPGMAVFTRYSKVMEADGSPMTVRAALALINQTLDEVLAEQEGEFDADTRWAVAWFEQFGMDEGLFGVAETLSKAKDTAVGAMVEAGILYARAGKVRLLRREELLEGWDPATDRRFTIWEATQYLIWALDQQGEQGAAELLRKLGTLGESARDLAYRLYSICERKKWAQEALAYNGLVIVWPEITRLAQGAPTRVEAQTGMFESEQAVNDG